MNNMEEVISSLKDILEFLSKNNPLQVAALVPEPPKEAHDFQKLKELLQSPVWPSAVPDFLICGETEEDKQDRADGIIEAVQNALLADSTKKFLDFGCGEGHVVLKLPNAVGYDIKKAGPLSWDAEDSKLFTDWEKIKSLGPFDYVIIYDVLDHSVNAVDALKKVKEVCTTSTKIFCRCHPWTGPHASHLYNQLNKAYIHLIFTDEELEKLGLKTTFVQKVYLPLAAEKNWFKDAGFAVVSEDVSKVEVPPFFSDNEVVRKRLKRPEWDEFPKWQMMQAFNDFVLKLQ